MSDPHSVDDKSKVVQYPKRQPLDGCPGRVVLYHTNVSECESSWPRVDGGVCPSQHFTLGVPKDMNRGKSSRVFFSVLQWFLIYSFQI